MAKLEIVRQDSRFVSWRPAGEGPMDRTSHALVVDGSVWLVDPIDADGLDEMLSELGSPAGAVITFKRHQRDARLIAARLGVGVWADASLGSLGDGAQSFSERVPGTPLVSIPLPGRGLRRWWHEGAIHWPEAGLVVVGESVGNPPYYLLDGELLGLHPLRRGQPPPELAGLDVDQVLCGHGDGVAHSASRVLSELIGNGPGRRSWFWMFRTFRAYR